ncbi:MAG TPA: ABC-F family ATP-binding cassette domain-containing protein [Stellaceae bacterium]|jgi:ATP-binding cassette subfamily F protein 3|nr:ABC-F family ATP-binding cassette domain-containing protein [Stellaceae bacterium]
MLTLSGITYRIEKRRLFDRATAQIPDGAKVGLVGRNGVGKSTLLNLIRGVIEPEDGTIELPGSRRIGFLAQEAPGGPATPFETVLGADRERARLLAERDAGPTPLRAAEIETRLVEIDAYSAPSRAGRILAGLGLDDGMQQRPLNDLSGGWRMRVALAAVLVTEPDLLLLDEPTNHLDLEASLWLERFLRGYRRTLILVSHDRRVLNAVTTTTLHLERGKLTLYSGGFDAFVRARRENAARLAVVAKQQEDQRQRLQAFVDRFRAKASKARQAQSRLKALARLDPVVLAVADPPPRIAFPDPPRLSPPLISLERASVGYAPGKPVLSRLDLRLDPDERVALLGANGNGKTTFARLLAGRLALLGGRMSRSPKLACGYFAQHQIEEMRPGESAYEHLSALLPNALPETLRARLGGFGFGEEKAFVPVAELSGGERARLNLALVTYDAPSLLILDEPTNHLDLEAREALVRAINEFPGAVVLVSHDWHLLELTADRLWLVADGTVQPFDGDLDDYRRRVLEPVEPSTTKRPAETDERRAARRRAAEQRRALDPLRQRARAAEETIVRLTRERDTLDRALAGLAGARANGAAVGDALKRRAEITRLIATAESDWLNAEETLEREARE